MRLDKFWSRDAYNLAGEAALTRSCHESMRIYGFLFSPEYFANREEEVTTFQKLVCHVCRMMNCERSVRFKFTLGDHHFLEIESSRAEWS